MTTPHSSWAENYDLIYTESFGGFYDALTHKTLDIIKNTVSVPAKIVDFGAGTGRLSLPLSLYGYEVLVVEPCLEMLIQLSQKYLERDLEVVSFNGKMQEFEVQPDFDMALCVFTVLLYLLDENELRKSIEVAYGALKIGGYLLIDIPSRDIFRDFKVNTEVIKRSVNVSYVHDDIYSYQENTEVIKNGESFNYLDNFKIKYWDKNTVLNCLSECGFDLIKDLSDEYSGTGSSYYLMQKL